jgi:glycosyltransferase involved in cell wall biosynthesis
MKKICFIVSSPLTVNSFLLNHFKVLSNDYEIYLVVNFHTNYSIEFKYIKRVFNVKISRKVNILYDILSLYKISILFLKFKFDVVHTITPKAGLLGMLAAYFCGVKVRIHIFTGQVWYTKHGFSKFFLINFDKLISILATNLIVDGNSQREFLLSNNVFSKAKSIVLGYGSISGVDIDKFKENIDLRAFYRNKFHIDDKQVVFSFLGRLNKDKGILDLVQAFVTLRRKYDFIVLVIIGVDEENIIQQIRDDYLVDSIIFINFVDKPEDFLQISDIFCMPSYREGFGTSVIQASSLSLPVLVSDTYGLKDAVIDNVTGLKHKVRDVDDLSKKMEILLINKDLRIQLGINGRNFVLKELTSNAISYEWFKYYRDLLK